MPKEDGVKAGLGEGDRFVTLANLAGGGVQELFAEEMTKVLRNIGDVNTEARAVREINIKIRIRPNEERRIGDVEAGVTSKVAPVKRVSTVLYIGRHKGEMVAVESDPKQRGLFENKPDIQPVDGVKGAGA
jgi:hypothetical protein